MAVPKSGTNYQLQYYELSYKYSTLIKQPSRKVKYGQLGNLTKDVLALSMHRRFCLSLWHIKKNLIINRIGFKHGDNR